MFIRFSLVVLIFTLVHGVNTESITNNNTTDAPTSTPTNITSTTSPPTSPPTTTTTTAPNTTTSPTPTPTLCPALTATSNQKLKIIDPSGGETPSPSSTVTAQPNTTRITVTCDTGYIMTKGQAVAIKCNGTHWLSLDDGNEWIPSTTPCQPIATIPPQKVCPRFPKLDQQTVKLIRNSPFIPNELYPLGEQLNTTCALGYRKTTQDYVIVTCIEQDGVMKWDGKGIETCFDIDCGPVTPPPHGRFAEPPPAELHVNTSIRIICDEGYHVIRGAGDVDDVITCIGTTGDASWDQAIPICTEDDVINNNNNTIDRNLTGTNEITNNDKAKRVAGGVIGGILGLAIIIICIYCLCAQHARTGRWINLGSNEPKHDGEELQNMNVMRGSADEDV